MCTCIKGSDLLTTPTYQLIFISCGCKLSAEDRYKMDKTAMGDIMSQGGGAGEGGGGERGAEAGATVAVLGEASELEVEEEEEALGGTGEEFEIPSMSLTSREEKELGVELEEILKQAQSKSAAVLPPDTSEAGQSSNPIT